MSAKDRKKNVLLMLNSMMIAVIESPDDEIERFDWKFESPVATVATGLYSPPMVRHTGEKTYNVRLTLRKKNINE